MTKFRLLIILLFSLIVSIQTTIGQTQLYGEWEVFCPMEVVEGKVTKYCDLCESEISTNKMMGKIVYGFDTKIDRDSLYLKNSEGRKSIKYSWDKETNEIEFQYKQKTYKFISLGTGSPDNLVLKDKDCLLLTFTRKKK